MYLICRVWEGGSSISQQFDSFTTLLITVYGLEACTPSTYTLSTYILSTCTLLTRTCYLIWMTFSGQGRAMIWKTEPTGNCQGKGNVRLLELSTLPLTTSLYPSSDNLTMHQVLDSSSLHNYILKWKNTTILQHTIKRGPEFGAKAGRLPSPRKLQVYLCR